MADNPTQGDRLPATFKESLPIFDKLTGRADYDMWCEMVKKILQQYDLDDLIDKSIPRPPLASDSFKKWHSISQAVSTWIITIIGGNIFKSMFTGGKPFQYADDAFHSIRTIVMGSGHNMAYNTLMKAWQIQRSHYGTVEQFTVAFRDIISDANRISKNTAFSPFMASSMLLSTLEPEFPAWAVVKQEKYLMKEEAVTEMMLDDFLSLCLQAIDEGRKAAKNSALYANSAGIGDSSSNSKSRSKSNKSKSNKLSDSQSTPASTPKTAGQTTEPKSGRIRRYPPKGMD